MSNKDKEMNYYTVLGVKQDASFEQLRSAYKKLVFTYHPDVNKDVGANEKIKEVLKAYSVLKDPESRQQYDEVERKNGLLSGIRNFRYECTRVKDKTIAAVSRIKLIFKNITSQHRETIHIDEDAVIDVFDELNEMNIEELEDRLLYSDNSYVRYNAAISMGHRKSVSSFQVLEASIDDVSLMVRKGVVFAIGEIGMRKGSALLKKIYDDAQPELKVEILKAVYKLSGKNSLLFNTMLLKGINDGSEKVRTGSLKLLLRINKDVNYDNIKDILEKMSFKVKEKNEKMLYAI